MAKAKKLSSGNWRAQVGWTDSAGVKHRESFTASTKQEAELLAARFKNDVDHRRADDLTVRQALDNYIEHNRGILSESTIYGYSKDANRMTSIHKIRIRKLTSADIQKMINELSEKGLAPKTLRNTYGTLSASLSFAGLRHDFIVHFPAKAKKVTVSPENEQVAQLYAAASDKMKICIALAGCHSMRRGEIAALKYKDLEGNKLSIHADIIWGIDNKWHYKETPKTDDSNRTVFLPPMLLDLIGSGAPEEFILGINPNTIGENFRRLKKKVGIDIRFHDLRHYFASVAVVLGIPELYTESLGGWKSNSNSSVLKEVYQNNIVSMSEIYAQKINEHFENNIMSAHKSAHG